MRYRSAKLKSTATWICAAALAFAAHAWAAPQSDPSSNAKSPTPPSKDAGQSAHSAKLPPLEIAQEGYLFAGGKYASGKDAKTMSGQIYVEYQIPAHRTHPYPIVFVHGGGQTGVNYTGTPDGREGWAQFFLRQGYAVYIIDQAGRGRSAFLNGTYGAQTSSNLDFVQQRFTASERYNLWPQAHLHTQWPGTGAPGDPIFDQFYAAQVPGMVSYPLQVQLTSEGLVALIDKIGPSIVLTHSQSGGMGWPVADARPEQVKAVIAVEPSGPPFYNVNNAPAPEWWRDADVQRPWGITAVPLTYSPAVTDPSELAMVRQDEPDDPTVSRCWLQKAPARQLPNLQKVPILVVTSDSSFHRGYDHCTVKYLEQAGVHVKWMKLDEIGIHGNGHMMMLEKNNMEIAAAMSKWLDKAISPAVNSKSAKGD